MWWLVVLACCQDSGGGGWRISISKPASARESKTSPGYMRARFSPPQALRVPRCSLQKSSGTGTLTLAWP